MCHSISLRHIFYMYFTQKNEKLLLIEKKCTIILTIAQKRILKQKEFKKRGIFMKIKRIIAGILVAATCGLAMAGCQSNTTSSGTVGDSTSSASESKEDSKTTGGKLIMATEPGFAPYEYMSGNDVVGIDVDIANEVAKELGMELEIQTMDFDGALLAVQQGKVDFAAAGISVTPERQEVMDFSIEYAKSKQVIVVLKGANRVKTVDDLGGDTKIAVQMSTVADFYVTDDLKKEPSRYTKYVQAAEDLKNDKVDCIVMDELPAKEMVKGNDNLEILDGEVFTDKYAFAFKKGNTELEDKVNKVLQKLIDNGKVDEFTLNHTK